MNSCGCCICCGTRTRVTLTDRRAGIGKGASAHAHRRFGAHEEPSGLVLLEAIASGLPVIAVREGAETTVVTSGQNGLLSERDEAHVAQAITCLLNNEPERLAMTTAARATAQLWDWDAAAKRLEGLLQHTASRRGSDTVEEGHAVYTESSG